MQHIIESHHAFKENQSNDAATINIPIMFVTIIIINNCDALYQLMLSISIVFTYIMVYLKYVYM